MKRPLLILLFFVFTLSVSAQLKPPTTTSKDTLYIVFASYNETTLSSSDWPATFLVEDAINIYIAGHTYRKGTPVDVDRYLYESSWGGHVDVAKYMAVCNGKRQEIFTVKLHDDCESASTIYGKYLIGDYAFYLTTNQQLWKQFMMYKNSSSEQ